MLAACPLAHFVKYNIIENVFIYPDNELCTTF